MPLFLLLTGAASCHALDRRTGGEYVRERFARLFMPLVFGVLVIVPPQVYLARLDAIQHVIVNQDVNREEDQGDTPPPPFLVPFLPLT